MKCTARCLELRLGDTCGRCGGLVDVKRACDGLSPSQRLMLGESMRRLPRYFVRADGELEAELPEITERRSEDGSMVFRRLNRMVPVAPIDYPQVDVAELVDELSTRPVEPRLRTQAELDAEPWDRYRLAWDYYARSRGRAIELASRMTPERCCGMVDAHGGPGCTYCPMGTRPIGTGPRYTEEAIIELEDELALANFQLAHDVVASMAEGPRPRAADDADGIQKAMREIQLAEQRRPISCAPGQHNFQFSAGTYTCTVCLRGKPEDGR
jgi:hypothetical protein